MGKNLIHHDPSEHHTGCIKGIFYHFHNRGMNFARKKLAPRRSPKGKWIAVGEADGSADDGGKYDSKMDGSAVEDKLLESGSGKKKSMKSWIKSLISEDLSKRRGRHKRSSSCPDQTQITPNNHVHHLQPPDNKSNVQVNEDITARSSPNVYVIEPSRIAPIEESRLFLDALDLLNMRKELFLKVLRDPSLSLAQKLQEKRLSKSRGRLTKSISFPCQIHYLTDGVCDVKNSSAGKPNYLSMSSAGCLGTEQTQRHPNSTGKVSPDSGHRLNTRQDKVVIKRLKNLGEKIRHAIKESRNDRQHIMKDAVLHKVPHGKMSKGGTTEKPSKTFMKNNLGQKCFRKASSFNDSVEKYNRLLESDGSREAKGKGPERLKLRTASPTPIKSIPKTLNRIYSSPDLGLYHGFQNEESPWDTSITSIYVDSGSNEGNVISGKQNYLESDNLLDSGEGLDAMSKSEDIEDDGKDLYRISKCESPEKFVHGDEVLDKISKCESQENFVDAGEDLSRTSKNESRENFVDVGDSLDRVSKCDSQENIGNAGEGSDRISKCESRKNFVDAGEGLDGILRSDGQENIEDVDEGSDRKSNCEHRENCVDAGFDEDDRLVAERLASQQQDSSRDGTKAYSIATQFNNTRISQVQIDKNSKRKFFDYVKHVVDLTGFNRNELLGNWHSPGQPVDPAVFDEVKDILIVQTGSCDDILLFDLVNEVLLYIYHKSSSYWPKPLSFRSSIHPMPMGDHVLEDVWAEIKCYLQWKSTSDQAYIDDGDAVAQDFVKYDGWMNLQFDSECVGLELEDLLFDDLLEELLSDIRN